MPEGHTLHRLAAELNEHFAGRAVDASSPQGRFSDSAAVITGRGLVEAEAYGKHLFLDFEGGRYVHVHLGLYGRFDVRRGAPVPPVGQVRLRLVASGPPMEAYADLRGATACELLSEEQRASILARLGPDPLREHADPAPAWARISRSATPIGALLMDQSVLAGIGNVYRAELLFRHRLHPLRPGRTVQQRRLAAMWADLVVLMHDGVAKGWIDTVRKEHTPEAMGREPRTDGRGGEVYVYRRTGEPCLICGTRVRTDVLAGRNLYWCPRCQPTYRARTPAVRGRSR